MTPLLFVVLYSSLVAFAEPQRSQACMLSYNTAISEIINDYHVQSSGDDLIDELCLNLTSILHPRRYFLEDPFRLTIEGKTLRTLIKELCIPAAPTLRSLEKVNMLLDMFWTCDMYSYLF